MKILVTLIGAIVLFGVCACGQKGALYLPEKQKPTPQPTQTTTPITTDDNPSDY